MKKTLAAIAVLGAFAGSALAADVTLYGRVDTGFQYNNNNPDIGTTLKSSNKFSMEAGQSSGSRWGLKGVEDLGAFKVGFILEDGFTSDDGAEKGVMFDRESALFIEGGFGKLAVGRIGSINQGTSSWGLIGSATASAFGTSYGNASVAKVIMVDAVRDNMIAYQTPTIAGFTGFVQYGMGGQAYTYKTQYDKDRPATVKDVSKVNTANGVENESSSDRYYAIGAKYANGPLVGYFAVDSINYKSWYYDDTIKTQGTAKAHDTDDSLTVTAAAAYNLDVAKVYFAAQYFDEVVNPLETKTYFTAQKDKKIKGYGLSASVLAPVAGGNLMASVGYVDASAADSILDAATDKKTVDFDVTRYQLAVGYNYALSKRTSVYAAASLLKDKVDWAVATKKDDKLTTTQAMFGLLHTF